MHLQLKMHFVGKCACKIMLMILVLNYLCYVLSPISNIRLVTVRSQKASMLTRAPVAVSANFAIVGGGGHM